LDDRETPVRDEQLEAVEEHDDSTDGECQRRQKAMGAAQAHHGVFDRGLVGSPDQPDHMTKLCDRGSQP
jgi:hypothetical protein